MYCIAVISLWPVGLHIIICFYLIPDTTHKAYQYLVHGIVLYFKVVEYHIYPNYWFIYLLNFTWYDVKSFAFWHLIILLINTNFINLEIMNLFLMS